MISHITHKRFTFFFFILIATFGAFSFAHAQYSAQGTTAQNSVAPSTSCPGSTNPSTDTLQNPLCATSIVQLLQEILAYVTYIGSIFLVLMLVYVGFQFVMARGNPEAVGKARNALLWTVVGGLLLLGAQAISIVIVSTATSL